MNDTLQRYMIKLAELDAVPSSTTRTPEEEARLDALVAELDDLYRDLTAEEQRQVDAPRERMRERFDACGICGALDGREHADDCDRWEDPYEGRSPWPPPGLESEPDE